MSKLEEMIERFCPDGVEYRTINEICTITRGRVMSKEYIRENIGEYPVYSSQTENNGELGKIKTYDFDGEYITWTTDGANAGSVFYRDGKFSVTNVCGLLKVVSEKIITKFLYYILQIEATKHVNAGMGNPKLMSNVMSKIKVAVPPLEVQCEIVRILDNFTELSAELSAELKARKGQFSYYRESLINSKNNITRLDDVVDIYLGLTHTPKYVEKGVKFISAQNTSKDYLDLENVKYISREEYDSITENAKPKKGDVLFTRVGSNLGHPVIVDTDEELCMFVSLGYLRIKDNNRVLNSYIKHWINTQNFWEQVRKYVHGSAKVNLNTGWLCKFEISIPSISEQKRIINILDKFEKLCNDISEGLPAEIESRRKQYEYYRDRLLTFKELKKEV